MILEAFFLAEEKRSMRTRIFQDLSGNVASGRNIHICASQPSIRMREPAFSLILNNGRSRAGGGVSTVRRRFHGSTSASWRAHSCNAGYAPPSHSRNAPRQKRRTADLARCVRILAATVRDVSRGTASDHAHRGDGASGDLRTGVLPCRVPVPRGDTALPQHRSEGPTGDQGVQRGVHRPGHIASHPDATPHREHGPSTPPTASRPASRTPPAPFPSRGGDRSQGKRQLAGPSGKSIVLKVRPAGAGRTFSTSSILGFAAAT
jgi:hypothetical protein